MQSIVTMMRAMNLGGSSRNQYHLHQIINIRSKRRISSNSTRTSSRFDENPSRESHNQVQIEYFTEEVGAIQHSITTTVDAKLAKIAASAPSLTSTSRILDVGAGEGALIPHLLHLGITDILAIDVCPAMLQALLARDNISTCNETTAKLGNEPCLRTWIGDIVDLPNYQGPFDVIFFNAVFGNLYSPREALIHSCFLLRPGSNLVISHPLGRKWHEQYRHQNPAIVPHPLPGSKQEFEDLLFDLPLECMHFQDDVDFYMAIAHVPEGYKHFKAPIYFSGEVITGFGRGSKQLGVPTANIPPDMEQLRDLPAGVYFGWAQVVSPAEKRGSNSNTVHKMVMNIGKRPTFKDKDPEVSVEVHIMHTYDDDFYGKHLRAVALGFLRPEIRFNGLNGLLDRIYTDIGIARSQLDQDMWMKYQSDEFFN